MPDRPMPIHPAATRVVPDIVNGDRMADVIFICDHASNLIPSDLGGLGLPPAVLGLHIAWDIGAADITRRLAGAFGAPAVLATVSRLVLDVNRFLDDPGSLLAQSDGIEVPGNRGASADEHHARAARIFHPYHAAIDRLITRQVAAGRRPALVAVHSCTDRMEGVLRPWHVGVLWGHDDRLARPLLASLGSQTGMVVGRNQPYSLQLVRGYTTEIHGERRGLPYVALEIRQDLIADPPGAAAWAGRIAAGLSAALAALD